MSSHKRKRPSTYAQRSTPYRQQAFKRTRPTQQAAARRMLVARTEQKAVTVNSTTRQLNTTGSFNLLNFSVPGTDINQRVGRKIMCKSIFIRGFISPEGGNTAIVAGTLETFAQLGRCIVFVDNQPNGAAPAVTDLLAEATSVSQLNLDNRDRFKVLMDKTFGVPNSVKSFTATGSTCGSYGNCIPFKKYKKIMVETVYNAGTAGTIADINSGALYMFWIGNVVAGTGTDTNATISTRVRFEDY